MREQSGSGRKKGVWWREGGKLENEWGLRGNECWCWCLVCILVGHCGGRSGG